MKRVRLTYDLIQKMICDLQATRNKTIMVSENENDSTVIFEIDSKNMCETINYIEDNEDLTFAEEMKDLKTYIEYNITETKGSDFYSESFCHLTMDYLGSMEDFSEKDIDFLTENGYVEEDFILD